MDGCEKVSSSRGLCRTHYERWRKHGDPWIIRKAPTPVNGTGPDSPTWKGDTVGYIGAHMRLRRGRGSARQYSCVECRQPAADWAYDYADQNQKSGVHDGRILVYSTDPARYIPMCKSCHKIFDLGHQKATAE
jgi:hypothetical protein